MAILNISDLRITLMILNQSILKTNVLEPYRGHIIAEHVFMEPYPSIGSVELLTLTFMDLLFKYIYPRINGETKFTLVYTMRNEMNESHSTTLTSAFLLTYKDGSPIPVEIVYREVYKTVSLYAERYSRADILAASVKAYSRCVKDRKDVVPISTEESNLKLEEVYNKVNSLHNMKPNSRWKISKDSKPKRLKVRDYITSQKAKSFEKTPSVFMVGDIETVPCKIGHDDVKSHVAYASGYMLVTPGVKPEKKDIVKFYSNDYHYVLENDFLEMSRKMLTDMINMIISDVKKMRRRTNVIYFHNLARFDGLILLRHLVLNHDKEYIIKPLIRNSQIYEVRVYTPKNRLLLMIRDSCLLIPGKLEDLGSCLCPEFGCKGSIDHDHVTVDNLSQHRNKYMNYLEQDILLLGGVMQKAQDIFISAYEIDVIRVLTISSMAIRIFRSRYYDDKKSRIYIPNENAEQFIRSGYYGGHADAYIPYGNGLYHYDVNSLYPYAMLAYDMPGGKPVWHNDLSKKNSKLEEMFGFIKALVICPDDMDRPYLPCRTDEGTLIFPTGVFMGTYYSEELKYSKTLGYKVYPLSGYLFERMESPFKDFVNDIYGRRLEAKEKGNKPLAFIHKTTMNSLYGRFGIDPQSTMSLILSREEAGRMAIEMNGFISSNQLDNEKFIVTYKTNVKGDEPDVWKKTSNTAVHIAAAITANARMYMYPYISRKDCFYTDTDSIVIKEPLPAEDVSPTVLGKFKLEIENSAKAIFIAAKSYMIQTVSDEEIIKHKGAGKAKADNKWFINQLADPALKSTFTYKNVFHRNWGELLVQHKESKITLGLSSKKRELVFNNHNQWVGLEQNPFV